MREILRTPAGAEIIVEQVYPEDVLSPADVKTIIRARGIADDGIGRIEFKAKGLNGHTPDVIQAIGSIADGTFRMARTQTAEPEAPRNRVSYFQLWMHQAANSPEGQVPAPPESWAIFEPK